VRPGSGVVIWGAVVWAGRGLVVGRGLRVIWMGRGECHLGHRRMPGFARMSVPRSVMALRFVSQFRGGGRGGHSLGRYGSWRNLGHSLSEPRMTVQMRVRTSGRRGVADHR